MVDITHKTCQHEGCTIAFNKPGEKIAIFCSKHKKEGMIDVKSKTCQHEGCTTRPFVINQVKKLLYFVTNIKKME